jgi:hypothetical protein
MSLPKPQEISNKKRSAALPELIKVEDTVCDSNDSGSDSERAIPLDQHRKTSARWYSEDASCDITDPDGWRHEADPAGFWYTVPITHQDYKNRKAMSTTTGYMKRGHAHPFQKAGSDAQPSPKKAKKTTTVVVVETNEDGEHSLWVVPCESRKELKELCAGLAKTSMDWDNNAEWFWERFYHYDTLTGGDRLVGMYEKYRRSVDRGCSTGLENCSPDAVIFFVRSF